MRYLNSKFLYQVSEAIQKANGSFAHDHNNDRTLCYGPTI
jgi:hypothetical protein